MPGTGSSSVVSPPSSANASIPKKKKSKSTFRVITEIIAALIVIELYFYHKLSLREFQELDTIEHERMERIVAPHKARKQRKQNQQQPRRAQVERERKERRAQEEREQKERRAQVEREQTERRAAIVSDLDGLIVTDSHKDAKDPKLKEERWKTVKKLQHMGVSGELELGELPPWSQITANFNSITHDDEPVILGLEYCAAFREKTDPNRIGAGPAGMFSTGTNLIAKLMAANCAGPNNRTGFKNKFALVQVPYGKHNPADARFHHQVKAPVVPDRDAILPVVAIRHPYTWMSAMCKHSYQTRWKHVPQKCHESLYLQNPIIKVPYGFKQYNETHNVTNSYDSLAHMWKNWYTPYFLDQKYNQTPRLIVRHEDLVYRPEKVISKVCECVGGTNKNPNPDWNHPDGFEYQEESANQGKGHGRHGRSGLLTAMIKYGQPLQTWYDQYSATDRKIMKDTFQGEPDPSLRKIFETFQYRLLDDLSEPSDQIKKRNQRRAMEEQRKKEAAYREKETAKKEEDVKKAQAKPEVVDKEAEKQRRKAMAEERWKKGKAERAAKAAEAALG